MVVHLHQQVCGFVGVLVLIINHHHTTSAVVRVFATRSVGGAIHGRRTHEAPLCTSKESNMGKKVSGRVRMIR